MPMLSIRDASHGRFAYMKRLRAAIDASVKEALARNEYGHAMALNSLAIARVEEIRRACEDLISHLWIQNELIANSR